METPKIQPEEYLLNLTAAQAKEWVDGIMSGDQKEASDFNLSRLAEIAALKARQSADKNLLQPSIDWAGISMSIYNRLASDISSEAAQPFIHSTMMLKAYLITRLGAIKDHPILGVNHIIKWFFDALPTNISEAKRKSAIWRASGESSLGKELKLKDIKELRWIKNQLTVIKLLTESKILVPNSNLNKWISLWEQLP
ncbi:MAG TPA: hypothetical protein VFD58_36600 [Blastocatellia bacterium]|nr:hypothetical protein [Blastocatellia bacterium]